MSLQDQLQSVYDRRGLMTPDVVVEEATPVEHPLHDRFDWNDRTAGHQWRRHQAAELIRSVRIVYREATETEPEASVRAWQAVRTPEGNVYEPVDKVANDPFLSELTRRQMEREWKLFYRRWHNYSEFVDMVRRTLGEEEAS